MVAQANRHEPKLGEVLQVVHQPVSPILGFHVQAEKPTVPILFVGQGLQERVVRVILETWVDDFETHLLHSRCVSQGPMAMLLHSQAQVRYPL